jgi:general secretion pathway protein H
MIDARRQRNGFTLVETMIVLAIVAVAIAVAMPLVRTKAPGQELRAKAQGIAALLRLARTLAISRNRETGVEIDVKQRRIALVDASRPVVLPDAVALKVLTARGLVVDGTATIIFTPQGGSSGGSIDIDDGNMRTRIAVAWLTGDVRTSVETRP